MIETPNTGGGAFKYDQAIKGDTLVETVLTKIHDKFHLVVMEWGLEPLEKKNIGPSGTMRENASFDSEEDATERYNMYKENWLD